MQKNEPSRTQDATIPDSTLQDDGDFPSKHPATVLGDSRPNRTEDLVSRVRDIAA